MKLLLGAALTLTLALAACSTTPEQGQSEPPETLALSDDSSKEAAVSLDLGLDDAAVAGADLTDEERNIIFIASVEAALAGTMWEGDVYAAPEQFLLAAEVLCESLDAGSAPQDAVVDYVTVLSGSSAVEDATTEHWILSGAVLGSSVGTYCPQHTADLENI